ncbi:MAG: hypothetical protein JW395_0569 [Nitrospira sp.]|nr:hypothetical protein [Nitrospira sp.]
MAAALVMPLPATRAAAVNRPAMPTEKASTTAMGMPFITPFLLARAISSGLLKAAIRESSSSRSTPSSASVSRILPPASRASEPTPVPTIPPTSAPGPVHAVANAPAPPAAMAGTLLPIPSATVLPMMVSGALMNARASLRASFPAFENSSRAWGVGYLRFSRSRRAISAAPSSGSMMPEAAKSVVSPCWEPTRPR